MRNAHQVRLAMPYVANDCQRTFGQIGKVKEIGQVSLEKHRIHRQIM